jgi:hypothetical protein
MSKNGSLRRTTQAWTVRAALAKYLSGKDLDHAVRDLNDAMRSGPQAWAFKPKVVEEPDDRTYYSTGGNV